MVAHRPKSIALFRWLLVQFLGVIILVALGIVGGWAVQYFRFQLAEEARLLEQRLVETRKSELRWRVEEVIRQARYARAEVARETARTLRDRVAVAAAELGGVPDAVASQAGATLEAATATALRQVELGGRGVVFAVDQGGTVQYFAGHPKLVGQPWATVAGQLRLATPPPPELFATAWAEGAASLPADHAAAELVPRDIVSLSRVESLGWLVGGAVGVADQEAEAQRRVLQWIASTHAEASSYIFVGRWDGAVLAGPGTGDNLIGLVDTRGVRVVEELARLAQGKGGFLTYMMPPVDNAVPGEKMSYVLGIPEWQWYVGAGTYLEEISRDVAAAQTRHRESAIRGLWWSAVAVLLCLLVGAGLAYRLADSLRREFGLFDTFFTRAATEEAKVVPGDFRTLELQRLGEAANRMLDRRKQSEERFRAVIESSPMGVLIYELGLDGRLVLKVTNPAAERILGIRDAAVVGRQITDVFPMLKDTEIPQTYARIARGGGVWEMEQMTYDDGSVHGVFDLYAFQVVRGEVAVFFLEVSDRERARRELRQSEHRFRTIVETAHEGILEVGEDLRMTFANRRLGQLLGYKAEGLLGHRLDEFMHPDELPDNAERVRRRKRGVAERYERRFVRKDGASVTMLVSATPLIEVGKFRGAYAMLVDISEQKRAAETIASLARFPDENPSPVLRVSKDGVLLYSNRGAGGLLESVGGAVGMPLPGAIREPLFRAAGGSVAGEIDLDAGQRAYSLLVTPLGKGNYFNVYGLEVTAQRRLEEQVRQAQKMEAIGRLAGGVAHDFNNILQAILGFIEIARDHLNRGIDCLPALVEVEKASQRAAELTRQLLAFGRRQMLRARAVDLNEKIADILKMLRRVISEDIELQFMPGHRLAMIEGDPVQIDQVLLNLAVNARDAMGAGGRITIETQNVEIDVETARAHPELEPGPYVLLSFTDTGSGMADEVMSHLFEPFFTTKELGQGTGLGLATVYGIVGQHGAAIDVHSEVGRGTRFRIYFPVAGGRPAPAMPGGSPGDDASAGHETVLIAEDDEAVRATVRAIIEAAGYRAIEAADGAEAVAIVRADEEPIQLVLLDVVMPRMGGVEALEIIRRERPDIRILFCSGYTASEPQAAAIAAGGFELLHKPYTRDQLLQALRRVLDAAPDSPRNDAAARHRAAAAPQTAEP